MDESEGRRVVGLFSGIGGLELGFSETGYRTSLLCDNWEPAQTVLRQRFPDVDLRDDVAAFGDLPEAEVITAGFPCTDLSQAGRTAGLDGTASGLVHRALDLVQEAEPDTILLENVPNLLYLNRGSGIRAIVDRLEGLGYAWAYRIIDTRAYGLPQRRRRVFLLASRTVDPIKVLFRSDEGPSPEPFREPQAYGFYWTEGNRGLGWAEDAIPPLKGSTTANIPSAPAIWLPQHPLSERFVTPSITAAEVLQGFEASWTEAATPRSRWKLVGNAVSVPIARWIAEGLMSAEVAEVVPLVDTLRSLPVAEGDQWPRAAASDSGKRWAITCSEWPVREHGLELTAILQECGYVPLSLRAATGFLARIRASRLRSDPAFVAQLAAYVNRLDGDA